MRRAWLAAVLAALPTIASAGAGLPSADDLRVLPPVPEGPRITRYLRHQLDVAWRHDAKRRERFARARTAAELEALKAEVRARALEALGGLPTVRTPLNPQVAGTIPMEGYRIEKLVFESLPGYHVSALVYLPDGPDGPRPAVLLACGHSPLGKAYPKYQEIAARLARRGYVVLCWDPVGQGERSQFWDTARQRSRYNLVCGEHAVLGNLATLAGANVARWMVWDGMRAADYLQTRPDVDPTRLGITGTSGGGFQSLWIGALDERIRVVAPSCFPTALPTRMANRIFEDPDSDPEQDPFGLVSRGVDHAGLLLLCHPRPVHVSAAVLDFFPIEGTRATIREAEHFYRLTGMPERLVLAEGYHRHSYSDENQASAFAFLDRWSSLPIREGLAEVETLPPEKLQCTSSGQVRVDLPGRSLVEIIQEYRREHGKTLSLSEQYYGDGYRAPRAAEPSSSGLRRPLAREAGGEVANAVTWVPVGSSTVGGVALDRYRLDHSDGLVLPLVHVHRLSKTTSAQGPTVLDFGLEGKATPSDWPTLLRHLENGSDVVTFDPRGLGETRMRYRAASIDDPSIAPPSEEEAYASPVSGVLANHVYNALLNGRPYLLQLIEDVEIAALFAREHLGAEVVVVSGRGEAAVVAAAAADVLEGIEAIPSPGEPPGSLAWWAETLEAGREIWPIHLLLPGGAALR
jgi:dienelactone hydrolase